MPYRRLPNTDEARLRALQTAHKKAKELSPFILAFSQSTYQQINSFLPSFEKVISEHRFNYASQVKRGKEYQQLLKKVRINISHFIQVMNMAVQRGDLPTTTRGFYGLSESNLKLPNLVSEKDLMEWGEKIIKGEMERTKKGLTPIANPTIGKVKVWYDNFVTSYHAHKTGKKSSTRYLGELGDLRKNADEIIAKIWNEVEDKYKLLPEEERRMNASNYGVVYVFRKNEINRVQIRDAVQVQLSL